MNSHSLATRSSALVISIAPLLLASACAATKPPVASAPATPTAREQPAAPVARSGTDPSTGTVAISDEIRKACGISSEDAFFAFDSTAIESADIKPLNAVAKCFTTGPLAGRTMRLIGHTDSRGPSEYNMVLGQRRADAVDGYIDRRGVQRSRVETTSRGSLDASGQDEAGWARDRRVDVQLGG